MKTLLKLLLFLVVFILGITLLSVYLTLNRPLPQLDGSIDLPGLQQEVDVTRDGHGVPTIDAASELDAFRALGYVHAQDRLWTMTLAQLAAEGRFAEFLGPDLIPFDQYQRTLGIWEVAQQIEATLSPQMRQRLQAYANGVNAYTEDEARNLPLEFALLDMKPIQWTPTYSIAMTRLMAWQQNVSWWSEVTAGWVAGQLPRARVNELLPDQPEPPFADLMPMLDLELASRERLGIEGSFVGSNAWAVSPSLSASGQALLAGDPHMGLNMAGNWYEVTISSPEYSATGATIPGAPFIIIGQNGNVAWSLTNMMADDTDFFVLPESQPDALSGSEIITPRNEVIRVKDGADTLIQVRETPYGPIISDIYPSQGLVAEQTITLKWAGHTPSMELDAIYGFGQAQTVEEFREAAKDFHSPAMNAIVADKQGSIAHIPMARLPLRRDAQVGFREASQDGVLPQDWQQWHYPIETLTRINPEKGWVANSNNKIDPVGYPYYIGTFWDPASRITRVQELFASTSPPYTLEEMGQWQADVTSPHARDLLERLLPSLQEPTLTEPATAKQQQDVELALTYLLNWDYTYSTESTAASIFDMMVLELTELTLQDDLGEEGYEAFVRLETLPVRSLKRLIDLQSPLFDRTTTPNRTETLDDLVVLAVERALDKLRSTYGAETYQWRWGAIHQVHFMPPLFGEAAADPEAPQALKLIVERVLSHGPFPSTGHGMTINNGQYNWNEPFRQTLGASIRRLVDFAEPLDAQTILPTGQATNPFSEYFGDQTDQWLTGQTKSISLDVESNQAAATHQMTFKPD
ncbi:MAG: penicillin acylase family protein [Balneolaceae bacterium]|nr:penicillin acylase family protein [Balneolaceae bacterium]